MWELRDTIKGHETKCLIVVVYSAMTVFHTIFAWREPIHNFVVFIQVHDYCPRPEHIIHPCLFNPFRRAWAMRQCSVLKSDTFAACHSEVSYRPYYSRCIFDTCGCDSGGDCECLCTAIAAYAQECNAQGVHIPWRSNDFCRKYTSSQD